MTFEENLKTIAGYGYEELAEDLDGLLTCLVVEDRDTLEETVNLLAKNLKKANQCKMMLNGLFGAIMDKGIDND